MMRKFPFKGRLWWALMLLFPAVAHGFTLEQCVDSALMNSPAVAAASLEIDRSRIMKATAFDPPMTEITLKQETTGGGGPENGVYFGQEFDFPTQYYYRRQALSAQNELAAGRYDLLVAEVESEVAALYCSLLYSRELLRLNEELGAIYDEFCRVAAVRLDEGEAGRLELINAQRVNEKNRLERQSEMSVYESRLLEMKRLTGCESLTEPDDTLAVMDFGLSAGFDFISTARGKVAGREVTVAEKEYVVAKSEFLPGIKLGATVQALIKGFNPYGVERLPFEKGNFMGFEVGVTVPLFFGSRSARLKAADIDRRISRLNMESAENQALSDVTRLKSQLASISERLAYYRETALPEAEEIKRLASVSYEYGDISYIEYISNIETAYEIFREYAGCINDYNQTALQLWKINK